MRLAGDDAKAADRYWTCSTFQISKSGAIFSKNAGASSYACVFTSSAPRKVASTGAILQFRRHDGSAESRCRFPTTYQHCGRAPFGARPPDTHSANETALRCPRF